MISALRTLEVPVDSLESAVIAAPFATRLELCDDLSSEGWTPTTSLIRQVRAEVPTHLVAMIRPRFGDSPRALTVASFTASKRVKEASKRDIQDAAGAGAQSVAIGLLTSDGHVDMDSCQELADLARSLHLEVSFHRVFDLIVDRARAMRDIDALGFKRVLTAGVLGWDTSVVSLQQRIDVLGMDARNASTAANARAQPLVPVAERMHSNTSKAPVKIVPAGGVRASNASHFLRVSPHLHSSCRRDGVIQPQELRRLRGVLDEV